MSDGMVAPTQEGPTSRSYAAGGLDFRFSIHHVGDTARLRIDGELDLAAHARLCEAFTWLGAAGARDVTADLSGISFCDCAGLGMLVAEANRLRRHGGSLVIAQASPAVHRLLALTALDESLGG